MRVRSRRSAPTIQLGGDVKYGAKARRRQREISRSAKLQAYNKNEEILKYFMATTARSAYRPSTGLDAARNPLC